MEGNIFMRVAAITAELQTVAKNLKVDAGKGSYKAVSERDVIDAVKPLEKKHGVCSYPYNREVIESQTLESDTSYGKKTTFFTRVKTTFRFVNVDDPTDYIETVVFSEGIDPQDKGSGKAMTYGDKYALMKVYKISTGDDPDQTASDETKYSVKKDRKYPVCEDCGSTILDTFRKGGEPISAEEVAEEAVKAYGRKLCTRCMRQISASK